MHFRHGLILVPKSCTCCAASVCAASVGKVHVLYRKSNPDLYVTQHRMHYAILITVRHIVNLALASNPSRQKKEKKPSSHSLSPSLLIECQISLSSHTPHRSNNNEQHRSRKSAASHSTRRSISLGYISRRCFTQIPRSHICEFSLLRQ